MIWKGDGFAPPASPPFSDDPIGRALMFLFGQVDLLFSVRGHMGGDHEQLSIMIGLSVPDNRFRGNPGRQERGNQFYSIFIGPGV